MTQRHDDDGIDIHDIVHRHGHITIIIMYPKVCKLK